MRISDWSSDVCSSDLGLPNGVPVFETIVVYENYPVETPAPDAALRLVNARVEERANYPLTLLAEPRADGLFLRLIVDRSRLPEAEATRILEQTGTMLRSPAEQGERGDLAGLGLPTELKSDG